MRLSRLVAILALVCLSVAGYSAEGDKEKAAFEAAYEAGATAISNSNWSEARQKFEEALRALGETPHPKKKVAQALLKKAAEQSKHEDVLATADELLRLKQWAEAEAAYVEAAAKLGESERIKQGIAAAKAGAKGELAKADPPKPVTEKPQPKIDTKGVAEKDGDEEALQVPEPRALVRDDWQTGPGSQCYWAGERLHLEEGDEHCRKFLKGDFAVAVEFEAQMDHRSGIRAELRPVKGSNTRARIIGWGSKEGSAPYLALDKDVKARGDEQPKRQQITLAFRRTGSKVEFFCNDKLVGHTSQAGVQAYELIVGGKGILDKAAFAKRGE